MVRAEHGDASYGYQIVGVVASLDMDSGIVFGSGLDSRQLSDEVYWVGIAEDLR